MRRRKRLCGVLFIIAALIIMTLPVSEADAASSASDFVIEGGRLIKYRGTETNVSVPDTVDVIGESAFEDKTHVELVVIPNSVKRIEAYAFWGCDNLDTVVLGRGLTEVGEYAFAGCKGLEQITIPANVTAIGAQAFGDCVNLTDVTIPVETVSIAEDAFLGCAKLTIHCQEGSAADRFAQEFYEKQKETAEYEDIPGYDGGDTGNDGGDGGTGDGDTGNAAGGDTGNGQDVTPAATAAPYEPQGTVVGTTWVVGNQAVVFADAVELEAKQGAPAPEPQDEAEQLPETSRTDGDGIPKYTIVDGTVVADQAYYKDTSLGEVLLPEGITEIGQFSFARSSLTEIGLPEGVTDISYGAFYHCDSLAEVTLPETVLNVEPKAFAKTGWMESFLQGDGGKDFLISGGVLAAYRGDSAEVIVPEGVRIIAAEAFAGHSEIETVSFPDSLRVIGEAAFEDCTGLREIHLNQGLEQIKDRAFCGAAASGVTIPVTVRRLGLKAFEGSETVYEGEPPAASYETSATRLSNASYRETAETAGEDGVTVTGTEGARAELEAAEGQYTLMLLATPDDSTMRRAWERVMDTAFPEDMVLYDMELTDTGGIPLTKLGLQTLTVTFPVPEALKGKAVSAVTTDRNGQLEAVSVTRALQNGAEVLCIRTTKPSQVGIYSVGEADGEELQELTVAVEAAAAPSAEKGGSAAMGRRLSGVIFLAAGLVLCFAAPKKRR